MHERQQISKQGTGRLGALLVTLSGLFVAGAAHGLQIGAHQQSVCVLVGTGLTAAGLAALGCPWQTFPQRALLVPPGLVIVGLALVDRLAAHAASALTPLLTICVVYIGLCQPPGTTTKALPVLLADWWFAYPTHPTEVLIRLPLTLTVWIAAGEIIADRTACVQRQLLEASTAAMTDPLTRVGNRRRLADTLTSLPVGGTVMFLDLDHFKTFNDEYGHTAGDEVLVLFATVAATTLRAGDLVARYGGEEFIVVLDRPANEVELHARLDRAWRATGSPVTFSAGTARRRPGETPQETVARADAALYHAKGSGRDRLIVDFSESDHAPLLHVDGPVASPATGTLSIRDDRRVLD